MQRAARRRGPPRWPCGWRNCGRRTRTCRGRPRPDGSWGCRRSSELLQRLAAQTIRQPAPDPLEADALIEAARRVPVEHIEVDALKTLGDALLSDRLHKGTGHATASFLGQHPDVLDEDAARAGPHRVVEGV